MTAEQMTARAELPRVSRVLADGSALALELESGERVPLGDRAALLPVQPDALAVLSLDWGRPGSRALAVPAELLPDLLPYFRKVRP